MTGFVALGVAGLLLLLVSLLVGDVLDGLNHVEVLGGDLFSTASLAGFLGTLGFVGAIVDETTGHLWWALAAGLAAGLLVGAATGWVTSRLRSAGEGSAPSTSSLVGREAVVTGDVPAGGFGQVRLSQGAPLVLNARGETPLPAGTRVWVSGVVSATAVEVRPVEALPPAPAD